MGSGQFIRRMIYNNNKTARKTKFYTKMYKTSLI